ncbi:UDP-N-acetylglucosamine transferase subunit ALG14 [Xenentodon cancila]
MLFLLATVVVPVVAGLVLAVRLCVVVKTRPDRRPGAAGPVSVLVVAGSGGHTMEILRLLGAMSATYTPRHYIIADTDHMSEEKICSFERQKQPSESKSQFSICRIPRSREVHQSWTSSVVSTLNSFWYCLPLVLRLKPDMVLCNGPGTCVPPCVVALLLGIVGVKKVLIVYVESICRVQTLSLTGRILYPLADYFFVQWAALRDRYPKSVFLGRIV